MEELNKNQIILLTTLVSFVVSIATSIAAVSLMSEAPPTITQTINRIVERTIEKVVPGETRIRTVVKETPLVVTEEQLVVEAVKLAAAGTVRLVGPGDYSLGSGFLVNKNGLIVTAASLFAPDEEAVKTDYLIFFQNGKNRKARLVHRDPAGIALLKLDLGLASEVSQIAELQDDHQGSKSVKVLDLSTDEIWPGQTVIALALSDKNSPDVSRGIIAGFSPAGTTSPAVIEMIKTNASSASNSGGPLLNIFGKVVGVNKEEDAAMGVKLLREALAKVTT